MTFNFGLWNLYTISSHISNIPTTPLITFICSYSCEEVAKRCRSSALGFRALYESYVRPALREWLSLLRQSCVNLLHYGQQEHGILEEHRPLVLMIPWAQFDGPLDPTPHVTLKKIIYGDDPVGWDLEWGDEEDIDEPVREGEHPARDNAQCDGYEHNHTSMPGKWPTENDYGWEG